ncbi:MAG: hypothetical protein AAFR03_00060 [Pseudomonadota bacterium]
MWNLASVDGTISMVVSADGSGNLSGAMTIYGQEYSVQGEWAASGSVAGRNFSSFSLAGSFDTAPSVPNLLAAAGIMTGPGGWPISVQISGNIAPSAGAGMRNFSTVLLPVMNTNANDLAVAYGESYVVLEIGAGGDGLVCTAGWIGPNNGGQASPFGSSDYKSAGTAMTAAECADVVIPDPVYTGLKDIRVPHIETAATLRPVMIQFLAEQDHFANPPLMEPHPHIAKVFYDTAAGALVLQPIDDASTLAPTNKITFNHGRGRRHDGGVVEFR